MAVAILLFGLIVGVMHISGPVPVETGTQVANTDVVEEARKVAAAPVTSSPYSDSRC